MATLCRDSDVAFITASKARVTITSRQQQDCTCTSSTHHSAVQQSLPFPAAVTNRGIGSCSMMDAAAEDGADTGCSVYGPGTAAIICLPTPCPDPANGSKFRHVATLKTFSEPRPGPDQVIPATDKHPTLTVSPAQPSPSSNHQSTYTHHNLRLRGRR